MIRRLILPLCLACCIARAAHGQADASIEQARIFRDAAPPAPLGVDANGTKLPETESTSSDDDSFGAQQILKAQEKPQPFFVSGGASLIYTSNAALTRSDTRDDVFAVVNAGAGWTPHLANNLDASLGAQVSIFRYDRTSALDFESIGFGGGLSWNPPSLRGASVFARYDFTELLSRGGREILMDHTLTLGTQKVFAFGRSHALTVGALGILDFADPYAAQRHQLGAFVGYHLKIARNLDSDFLYRPAVHFYPKGSRTDFNQVLSANLRYRINNNVDLTAFLSYAANRSDRAVFDYDAFTTGAGVALTVRF